MDNKIMVGIIIAVILVGGWVLYKNNNIQTAKVTMDQQKNMPSNSAMQAEVGENTILIENYKYSPATLTVKVGDKVTWTNKDSVGHSATADDGSFDTGILSQNESGSITFNNPGTFTYYCSVHPNMKATIVVE